MSKQLKVYTGKRDGRWVWLAAANRQAVAEALGLDQAIVRGEWFVSSNDEAIAAALAAPGVPLERDPVTRAFVRVAGASTLPGSAGEKM